jgi:hypothetical protein
MANKILKMIVPQIETEKYFNNPSNKLIQDETIKNQPKPLIMTIDEENKKKKNERLPKTDNTGEVSEDQCLIETM